MSDLHGDGADLVNKAFAGQQPVLALEPPTTGSETSEQKGFANLLIGLFGAVRNPLAHALKIPNTGGRKNLSLPNSPGA